MRIKIYHYPGNPYKLVLAIFFLFFMALLGVIALIGTRSGAFPTIPVRVVLCSYIAIMTYMAFEKILYLTAAFTDRKEIKFITISLPKFKRHKAPQYIDDNKHLRPSDTWQCAGRDLRFVKRILTKADIATILSIKQSFPEFSQSSHSIPNSLNWHCAVANENIFFTHLEMDGYAMKEGFYYYLLLMIDQPYLIWTSPSFNSPIINGIEYTEAKFESPSSFEKYDIHSIANIVNNAMFTLRNKRLYFQEISRINN